MTEPTSKEEYEARFHQHERVTGFGIDGVEVHMPCPFCAAPDWAVYKLIEVQEAMREEHVCAECGRGAKMLVVTDEPQVKEFRFVQTRGSDPPPWCLPMARL